MYQDTYYKVLQTMIIDKEKQKKTGFKIKKSFYVNSIIYYQN